MHANYINKIITNFIETANRHIEQLQKKTSLQKEKALDFNNMPTDEFMKYFDSYLEAKSSNCITCCCVDKEIEDELRECLSDFEKIGFNEASVTQLHNLKRCLENALRFYTNLSEECRGTEDRWISLLSFKSMKTPHPLPIESFDLRGYIFFKKYGKTLTEIFERNPNEQICADLVEILSSTPGVFPEAEIEKYFGKQIDTLNKLPGKFPIRELEEALTRVQLTLPLEERGEFVKSCFQQCDTLLTKFPLTIPDVIHLQDRDIMVKDSTRLQKVRDLYDLLQTNEKLLDQGSPNRYPEGVPNLLAENGRPEVLVNNQDQFLRLIDLYHKHLVGGMENSLRASRKMVNIIDKALCETNALIEKSHQLV